MDDILKPYRTPALAKTFPPDPVRESLPRFSTVTSLNSLTSSLALVPRIPVAPHNINTKSSRSLTVADRIISHLSLPTPMQLPVPSTFPPHSRTPTFSSNMLIVLRLIALFPSSIHAIHLLLHAGNTFRVPLLPFRLPVFLGQCFAVGGLALDGIPAAVGGIGEQVVLSGDVGALWVVGFAGSGRDLGGGRGIRGAFGTRRATTHV